MQTKATLDQKMTKAYQSSLASALSKANLRSFCFLSSKGLFDLSLFLVAFVEFKEQLACKQKRSKEAQKS